MKDIFKRIFITFMCSLMAISVFQLSVSAAMVNVNIQVVPGHPYRGTGTPLSGNGNMYERYDANAEILTVGNTKVFCIEPWATLTNGLSVTEGDLINELNDRALAKDLSLIAYYGYWTTAQTVEDYQTTQIMIWERRGWSFSQVPSYYNAKKAAVQDKITNHAKELSFSGQTITINVGETIHLEDTNGALSAYMKAQGYKAGTSYTEKGFSFYWWENTLHMRANADADENVRFNFFNIPERDQGTNIVYVNPGKQSTSPLRQVRDPARSIINFNVQKYGKIQIVKKDAQSQKVVEKAGIKYDIYKTDGTKVSTIESNEQGIAQSGLLLFGDYYYVETLAPEDYQINTAQHPFTVDTSTNVQEFVDKEIVDERVTGRSTLTKVIDGDKVGNAKIDGAVYGFYARENILDPADGSTIYEKDEEIGQYTIVNGTTTAEVDYLGKYYWKEITPSDGCKVAGTLDVDLLYDNQNVPVIVKDMISYEPLKKQAFRIQKLEDPNIHDESIVLKDAEFTVKLKSDIDRLGWDNSPTYDKLVTDELGSATSIELPYGTYVVRETKTPTVNHDPVEDFEVKVSEDNREPQTYRYFIDNILKTKLAVYKRDAETENIVPLSGMKFKVKCVSGTADFKPGEYVSYWQWSPIPKKVDTWETTEDGYVFLELSLRAGTYQLEEIESPEGYLLNKEPIPFTITRGWHQQLGPDDETLITTVEMHDAPVKGQVKIDKQAELFKGYESTPTEYGDLYTPKYETGLLPNVTFEIKAKTDIIGADGKVWYKAGRQVTTMTTDGINITASPLLPIGTEGNNLYTLQEIETEEGYVVDDTVYTFRFDYVDQDTAVVSPTYLDENGNEIEFDEILKIENDKQKALILDTKNMEESIFENTGSIKDVLFGFYSENVPGLEKDSLIGLSTVNSAGNFNLQLTQAGSYYAKELSTNDDYVLDENKYPFEFTYKGDQLTTLSVNQGKPIYNLLKRGSLEIYKLDEESEKPLVNVPFELAIDPEFNEIIKTSSTDENGRLLFEELEANHMYYVREKYDGNHDMVINGYVYDPTIYEVMINDVEIAKLDLTNKQVKGIVQFTKTGESFKNVELVEGEFGTEHHPVWSQGSLLGATLTVIADEDITTWDGTEHYKKGDVVTELSSEWNTVDSLLLPVGKYKAYESGVPIGYIKDETVYEFEITPNGKEEIQLNLVTINNTRAKANINFTKHLETQETFIDEQAYEDVVFGLYARSDIHDYMGNIAIEHDSLIGTSKIDANGHLINTYDLPIGSYYFKELKTNEQYVLDPNEYDFVIEYQGEEVKEFTVNINEGKPIENELIRGKIEILKYTKDEVFLSRREMALQKNNETIKTLSEDDKNFLGGVTFELATDKEFKNIVRTGKTNASGYLAFDELERGTYFIREKQALDFYEIDETVHEVMIKTNEQIETIDVDNNLIKSYIDIKKVDYYDNDTVLPYAGFTMYSDPECTQPIKEVKTGKDGIAHFDDIKFGSTVYIKETSAPVGYELSDEVVKVTIDEDWVSGDKETRIIVYPDQPLPTIGTGDNTNIMSYTLVCMISAFALLLLYKRKKQNIN